MPINMAQKRAKKAQKRKLVVAEKRRIEAQESSLPARVLRASQAPIRGCFLTGSQFEAGMGTLMLVRGATNIHVEMVSFLLDTFCLGVKDAMYKSVEGEVFENYLETANAVEPLLEVDPAYARKLLRDLVAWSQSLGFPPHADFAALERMFGDVDADASDAVFTFGHDGKPLYIPGPHDSPYLIRQRVELLRKQLGDDGYDLVTAA
ncbi:MAG: hypothetical protein ABW175_05955 [Bradyrhizobium sp.]